MSSELNLDLAWLATAAPLMSTGYWTERGTRAASMEFAPAASTPIRQEQEPHRKVGRWFEQVHLAALQNADVDILTADLN